MIVSDGIPLLALALGVLLPTAFILVYAIAPEGRFSREKTHMPVIIGATIGAAAISGEPWASVETAVIISLVIGSMAGLLAGLLGAVYE